MNDAGAVDIALATFNGERFLAEQLASYALQSRPPGRIWVGDDGSTDRTSDLLAAVRTGSIQLSRLADGAGRLGPRNNFSRILAATTAPYVALSDQDDRWHANRLSSAMEVMEATERSVSSNTPVLVCCDLRVIDATGRLMAPSFWRHQNYRPERGAQLRSLLVMNCFPGCGMLANRALIDLALPIPSEAIMHDWWLALVAATAGRLAICPRALVDYRIHPGNTIGIPGLGLVSRLIGFRSGPAGVAAALLAAVRQAQALEPRVEARMVGADLRRLQAFTHIAGSGWMKRRWLLLRHGIAKHGLLRQLNLLTRG